MIICFTIFEITFSGDSALSNGKWALSIDATGYTYPTAKTITIPDQISATITLTPMISDGKFKYKWSDDDSAAGHNTQSYYSEPTTIKVLDKCASNSRQNLRLPFRIKSSP